MKKCHNKVCPHGTEGEKTSFLKIGKVPKINANYAKMVLVKYKCTCELPYFMEVEQVIEEKQ